MWIVNYLPFYLRRYWYKCKYHLSKIGRNVYIDSCSFEGNNALANNVEISHCFVGLCSYVNNNSSFYYTKIGRYCSIADHVHVCIGNHPVQFVTTHPAFYYDTTSQIGYTIHKGNPLYDTIFKYPENEADYQVIIGNDVWVGSHALIMGGVKIGDGAIIAAGAVVTKDVEPYSIVAGVPAKIIRYRFEKNVIETLLKSQWWNRPYENVRENYLDYINMDRFLDGLQLND